MQLSSLYQVGNWSRDPLEQTWQTVGSLERRMPEGNVPLVTTPSSAQDGLGIKWSGQQKRHQRSTSQGQVLTLERRLTVMALRGGGSEVKLTVFAFPQGTPTSFESAGHPWWKINLDHSIVSPGSLTYLLGKILGAVLDGGSRII